MTDMTVMNRRGLLKGSAGVAAATTMGAGLNIFAVRQAMANTNANGEQTSFVDSPYGPIRPVNCLTTGLPLLQLPRGFKYHSFGWAGDIMADGQPTPGWHDGMDVVSSGRGRNVADVLIRNHEYRANGPKFFVKDAMGNNIAAASYDPAAGAVGGCTALRVLNGALLDDRAVIAETDVNCAGGGTPWGTWLTCEETVDGPDIGSPGRSKTHGWVFEVSPNAGETVAEPIVQMGRFAHEAVAVDPKTRDIYQTEDARNIALFYRFIPASKPTANNDLRTNGGKLYGARIVNNMKADLNALARPNAPTDVTAVGQSFQIEWVEIPNPGAMPRIYSEPNAQFPLLAINTGVSGTFAQGRDLGCFRMSRGEGCWYSAQEDAIYYADTNFGYDSQGRPGRGGGALWRYTPDRNASQTPVNGVLPGGTLELVFAGVGVVGNAIDNVTVSPRGGVLCFEDGAAVVDQFGPGNRILGYNDAGLAYIFAKNNINLNAAQIAGAGKVIAPADYRGQEFAGGCFNASGKVLYVNVQTPGITFAITGPWARGNI